MLVDKKNTNECSNASCTAELHGVITIENQAQK